MLGGDESVEGTVKDQASRYLGETCDDQSLRYMSQTALVVYGETMDRAAGYDRDVAHRTALTNVLIAGAAIGKRLGIEDGEEFGRSVGDPNGD